VKIATLASNCHKKVTISLRLVLASLAVAVLGGLPRQADCQVMGYYNVTVTNGYNFMANPLDQPPDNSITNVIPSAPDGTKVYLWDVPTQIFQPPSTYSICCGWTVNVQLPPGKGFVVYANTGATLTFVGNLLAGSLTNSVAGANRLSLLGSKIAQAGPLSGTNSLQFPGTDGDDVYTFSATRQSYSDAFTYIAGYGWSDPNRVVGTNGPFIAIAQSFFVRHPGPDTNWVVNVAQPASPPPSTSLKAANGSATPVIKRLTTSGGAVTLQISSLGGGAYNVQFSADGLNWSTVAQNQTGATWTGPYRGGARGYYRLINP
jgi:hypothetical protein